MLAEFKEIPFGQSRNMAALLDKLTGMNGRWQYGEESGNQPFPHVYIELEGAHAAKLASGITERLEKAGIFSGSKLKIDGGSLYYGADEEVFFSIKQSSGKLVLEFNQQIIDGNPELLSLFREAEENHGQSTCHKPAIGAVRNVTEWMQACVMRANPQGCERLMNALLPSGTIGKWKAESLEGDRGNHTQFHLKLTPHDVARIDDILDAMHTAGMIDKYKSVNTYGGSLFLAPTGNSSHISLIGSGDGPRFRADTCFLTQRSHEMFMQMARVAEEKGKAKG